MATMSSSHWLSWRPRSRWSHPLNTCMVVCLLLTCAVSAATAYDLHYYGSMTPSDPMIVTGSTLELNCTMSDVLEGENASTLYFNQGNRRIPDEFVKVVNDRTVTLQYPNAQRYEGGHWFCRLPSVALNSDDDFKLVGQQSVVIADLPVQPHITGCVVYNWDNMTCTWEPKVQDTGLVTNQTLYWTLQHPNRYHCPHSGGNNCTWLKTDGQDSLNWRGVYYLYVNATNELGMNVSKWTYYKTDSIVKPDRVKNLRVYETGHNYTNLTWKPPSTDKDILYKVRYMSSRTESWDEMNVTSRKASNNEQLNSEWVYLTGLTPFTEYTVSVTCLPASGYGFWSPTADITYITDMSVPSAAPVIPPGGFSISIDHGNTGKRKVDILWQSIPEPSRNGEIIKFRLRYGPEPSEMTEFDATATIRPTLVLDRNRTYWVTLEAANRVGYNNYLTLSPLLIPKEDKLPPKPSKLVSVAWKDDFVFVNWTAVEAALGYTVYWCKGSQQYGTCDPKNEMQWTPIDVNCTSHNVTLDSGDDSKEFIFGVSAELLWDGGMNRSRREAEGPLVVSSGVLWSKCTYDIKKSVSPPTSVDLSDHQNALSISLRWQIPLCGDTIYIDKYIIFYCKVADCPAEDSGEEGDSIVRLEVDSSKEEETILDLEPTEYRMWMRSYSSYKKGLSPPTERKTVTVSQSGPSKAVIAVVSVISLILLFFIVYGLYHVYKTCQKKVKENMNVMIERPPEVANHIDRMFDDDDRDDYMVHYTNLVDQDQQLSEQNSLIRENQANQQRERPHPNGDINARARVYLGDGSAGGRKLNGTASDNHNDMVPLHSPPTGQDGLVEDMNGGMRALPATPQDVSMKVGAEEQPLGHGGQQRSANGGKVALPYSQKANSGQQSAGSAIPSYSKCGLPDDGEAAHRAEEPIYQIVDGEEEPSESPASLPPPTYSAPPPAPTAASCQPAGREEKGTAPTTGVMDQAPSVNSNSSTQAPAAYTVLPVGEKTSSLPDPGYSSRTEDPSSKGSMPPAGKMTSSLPDPGYSAWTEDPSSKGSLPPAGKMTSSLPDPGYSAWTEDPTSKGSLSTGEVAPGGGAMGQGSSSVSPYCQMVSQSDCSSLPQGGTEGANMVEQHVDYSPQVATSPLADGRNTSDYQQQIPTDPSVHNSYSPIPPEDVSTTDSMGTPQNGQLTTAQIPSGHVSYSPFSDDMPSLSIKNSNNGYVTVNM